MIPWIANRCWLVILVASVASARLRADEEPIRLAAQGKAIEVAVADAADRAVLAKLAVDAEAWPKILAVHVDRNDPAAPALLGSCRLDGAVIRFEPRFPLVPGVTYRVAFDPSQIRPRPQTRVVQARLSLPKPEPKAATVVAQVYPTANRLPENQLKFYLHFSAPMSRGDCYRHIKLLDADGKPVVQPFLEIDQELWDPEGKRLTLVIDPGRIKRGLKPREDLGPVLEQGKQYTLVIDRAWTDAADHQLKETHRKTFQVGASEERIVDPKAWKVQAPAAAGREPLTVGFPKPLDHALLQRMLCVQDADGHTVAGKIEVDADEKRWRFVPDSKWPSAKFKLVADTRLEDLAGNNIARPFEVDAVRPVERPIKAQSVVVPFEVPPN